MYIAALLILGWGIADSAFAQSEGEVGDAVATAMDDVDRGRCDEAFRDASVPIEVVANAPIDDLARIFLDAKIVIANDCGPAHLAQMAGTPTVQPFDNSNGQSDVAIGSWFDRRPGAICLTPSTTAPIDAIPVEAVFDAARDVLDDPATEGAVRHVG